METLDGAIAKRIILAARTNVCHYYRGGPLIRTASRENECQRREARARWNNRAGTPRAMGPIGPTRPWWEKECKWNRRCEIFRVPLMRLDEFEHENTYIITHGSESTIIYAVFRNFNPRSRDVSSRIVSSTPYYLLQRAVNIFIIKK